MKKIYKLFLIFLVILQISGCSFFTQIDDSSSKSKRESYFTITLASDVYKSNRMAAPALPVEIYELLEITITDSEGNVYGAVKNGEKFKIKNVKPGTYNIEVKYKKNDKIALTGSTQITVTSELSYSGKVELNYVETEEKGNISLSFDFPDFVNSVSLIFDNATSQSLDMDTKTFAKNEVSPGNYTLRIILYSDEKILYTFSESIVVKPNLTTKWLYINGSQFINLNGEFTVTEDQLQKLIARTVYVMGADGKLKKDLQGITITADDNNSGTIVTPLASMQKAIDKVLMLNDKFNSNEANPYKIIVDGTIEGAKASLNINNTSVNNLYLEINGYSGKTVEFTKEQPPSDFKDILNVNDKSKDLISINGNAFLKVSNLGLTGAKNALNFENKASQIDNCYIYNNFCGIQLSTNEISSVTNSVIATNDNYWNDENDRKPSAIYSNSPLRIENISVLNNKNFSDSCGDGVFVYSCSQNLQLGGKVIIENNTGIDGVPCNLYISDSPNAKIEFLEGFSNQSKIHVDGNYTIDSANPSVTITEKYSEYCSKSPSEIFISDSGNSVGWDSAKKEVVLGSTTGNIKYKVAEDVVLLANGTAFINGEENIVEIVPKIDGIKIENNKLSDWKLKLKCFGSEINLGSTSSTTMPYKSGHNKIVFPANTPVEGVTVYAEVKYNGAAYSTEVILTDDNILNLTSAPVSGQRVAITNQDGWNKLGEFTDNHNPCLGVQVVLASDVTLMNPTTIGKIANQTESTDETWFFRGSLDGQGHSIILNSIDSNFKNALFTRFGSDDSILENIIIEGNLNISQQFTGLVVCLRGGIVRNCINRCSVTTTSVEDMAGLVAYAGYVSGTQSATVLEIIDCRNEGNLSGKGQVGGIISKSSLGGLKVRRCKNSGSITGVGAGGIVGGGYSLFEDCMNSGTITGKNYAGGIAGTFYQPSLSEYIYGIYNSYNTGTVNVTGISGYCGGIAGYIGDSSKKDLSIANCYNNGTVTANDINNVGGFVGGVNPECNQTYIKNNFYYKPESVNYFGYAGASSDDSTKVKPFTSCSEIQAAMNTWVTNANPSDGYKFSNWTITYKNGKPQLDLNIFLEE